MYKYIIRKIKIGGSLSYIPIIRHRNEWKYLIKKDNVFMVSKIKNYSYDKIIDAYKFIASHRMTLNTNGIERPKHLYFKYWVSIIPFIGIFYFIHKIIINIPIKYLFISPFYLILFTIIQITSLLLLLLLFII